MAVNLQKGQKISLDKDQMDPVDKFTKTRDVYYKFTLKLMNLKTGLVEWQDEQEIRKTAKRGLWECKNRLRLRSANKNAP